MHGTELDSPAWEEDNISTKTEENQTIEDETQNGGHIHLLMFQYALRQVENLTLTSMYSNLHACVNSEFPIGIVYTYTILSTPYPSEIQHQYPDKPTVVKH